VISFGLDEEQQLIQDNVRKFAEERLWPRIRETEAARELPAALVEEAHGLGLRTLSVPEQAGGQGLGLVTACLVEEQLAWGDASACYALGGAGALVSLVVELGDAGQHLDVLSRFTADDGAGRRGALAFGESSPAAAAGMRTTAEETGMGWLIEGDKAFVVNGGVADRYVVVAQVDPSRGWDGLGAFVVPGDARGVSPGSRRRSLGLDAAHIADVSFDGVRVPETARLAGGDDFGGALLRGLARHSLLTAARCVGVAQRAFELTRDYCAERTAFGKPIGHFQAVAFDVADRLIDVEGARWMVWKAAADWDTSSAPRLGDVASACAHASEAALRCGDTAVQLHGGAGFVRDFAVEKLFRDARQLSLMATSAEALGQIVAEEELGRPHDLAALLPTTDIQPVCL